MIWPPVPSSPPHPSRSTQALHTNRSSPAPTLPLPDRLLLAALQRFVPRSERQDWVRSWQGELWHRRHLHQRSPSKGARTSGLSFGMLHDALWLRTESCKRALTGTAGLCLAVLSTLLVISALPTLAATGSWNGFSVFLLHQAKRFVVESALIVFVSFATASRYIEQNAAARREFRLKPQLFSAAKTTLILLLTFLLSTGLCHPLGAVLPLAAALLQNFLFTLLALLGLRWSSIDTGLRCKRCLRSLATPARVGRPSYNFLEWNGTELLCKQGHGLLSIPELETSWCQASRWIAQDAA